MVFENENAYEYYRKITEVYQVEMQAPPGYYFTEEMGERVLRHVISVISKQVTTYN